MDSFNKNFNDYAQNKFEKKNMSDSPVPSAIRTITYYNIRTNLIISMLKAAELGIFAWTRTTERVETYEGTLRHKI